MKLIALDSSNSASGSIDVDETGRNEEALLMISAFLVSRAQPGLCVYCHGITGFSPLSEDLRHFIIWGGTSKFGRRGNFHALSVRDDLCI